MFSPTNQKANAQFGEALLSISIGQMQMGHLQVALYKLEGYKAYKDGCFSSYEKISAQNINFMKARIHHLLGDFLVAEEQMTGMWHTWGRQEAATQCRLASRLADIYLELDRLDRLEQAEMIANRALDFLKGQNLDSLPRAADIWLSLADVYLYQKKIEKAVPIYHRLRGESKGVRITIHRQMSYLRILLGLARSPYA